MRAARVLQQYIGKSEHGHGEGSRGGHIIGHTKNGRAVYADHRAGSPAYAHFDAEDHQQAARIHQAAARLNATPSFYDNPTDEQLAPPAVQRSPTQHYRWAEDHRRAAAYLSGEASRSRLGRTTNFYRIPTAAQSPFAGVTERLASPAFASSRQDMIDTAIKPEVTSYMPMSSADHEDMARAYEQRAAKVPDRALPQLVDLHRAAAHRMAQVEAGSGEESRRHAQERARAVQEILDTRRRHDQMYADTAKMLGIPKELAQKMPLSDKRTASGKPILPPGHPAFSSPAGLRNILPTYSAQDHRDAAAHLNSWAGGMIPDRGATASDDRAYDRISALSRMHADAAAKIDGLEKHRLLNGTR